jgi:hypothetical protein
MHSCLQHVLHVMDRSLELLRDLLRAETEERCTPFDSGYEGSLTPESGMSALVNNLSSVSISIPLDDRLLGLDLLS